MCVQIHQPGTCSIVFESCLQKSSAKVHVVHVLAPGISFPGSIVALKEFCPDFVRASQISLGKEFHLHHLRFGGHVQMDLRPAQSRDLVSLEQAASSETAR